jgi:hypothetical protein
MLRVEYEAAVSASGMASVGQASVWQRRSSLRSTFAIVLDALAPVPRPSGYAMTLCLVRAGREARADDTRDDKKIVAHVDRFAKWLR